MRTFKKSRCLRFSKIMSSLCNDNLSFEFCQGSTGVAKKVTKLTPAEMSLPFRNVTRDRDGCAPHLIGQTVSLSLGKGLSHVIDGVRQVLRFLPGDQVLVMLCHCSSAYRQKRLNSAPEILILTSSSQLGNPSPSEWFTGYWVLGTHPECLMCMTSPSCTM
jgi:hypothetical protein